MKKLIILLLIIPYISLQAQRFQGGLIVGMNASQVDGDTYAGYNKIGFTVGAYTYTSLSRMTDIQLEIKYTGKGARKKTTEYDPSKFVNQLNYIEIPIILRFKTGSRIDFEGGLAYGYLFNNTMKDDYNTEKIEGLFNTSDFSGLVGILYKMNEKISLSMRASYSLLTIRDDLQSIPYLKSRGVYNNVLTIAFYYKFSSETE
jgi:hypothetical protein